MTIFYGDARGVALLGTGDERGHEFVGRQSPDNSGSGFTPKLTLTSVLRTK